MLFRVITGRIQNEAAINLRGWGDIDTSACCCRPIRDGLLGGVHHCRSTRAIKVLRADMAKYQSSGRHELECNLLRRYALRDPFAAMAGFCLLLRDADEEEA